MAIELQLSKLNGTKRGRITNNRLFFIVLKKSISIFRSHLYLLAVCSRFQALLVSQSRLVSHGLIVWFPTLVTHGHLLFPLDFSSSFTTNLLPPTARCHNARCPTSHVSHSFLGNIS
ncbi:uncharacterized protein LOC118183357 [Stegodyphus dumicola]|uniref:uncharacterized protein LOC118183357 n=1 Tax=Stegodyphus dumicola TaxID=202533 RepID=UPI0015A9114A|nr:uncharacterized protein LOC118183357 [Stegodyphus dumicola]